MTFYFVLVEASCRKLIHTQSQSFHGTERQFGILDEFAFCNIWRRTKQFSCKSSIFPLIQSFHQSCGFSNFQIQIHSIQMPLFPLVSPCPDPIKMVRRRRSTWSFPATVLKPSERIKPVRSVPCQNLSAQSNFPLLFNLLSSLSTQQHRHGYNGQQC